MPAKRHKRLVALFLKASELPQSRRREFLERECAGDPGLRTELSQMLALDDVVGDVGCSVKLADPGHAETKAPTDESIVRASPRDTSHDSLRSLENYRLLQKLGEGGMGEVYLAEQQKPIRRRVALKLIKLGMDTKQVVARFESERQALAIMNHPNVAKVFDAGATEHGRPYFAMEYVKGEPITEYCDKHRLTTEKRLRLFIKVCAGVQHAHQKGIIHRDIKPTNVLVSVEGNTPVPKIIDFGVAKATEHRLTEKTVFTGLGVLIGTPEYMSPEQAEMTTLDIDTRTDVYSMGVLLYELLVGVLPFDGQSLRQLGLDEIRRVIREGDPPKPSTRVVTLVGEASTNAALRRQTDLHSLRKQLHGDLDWITMRALEKDRTRRYGSPEQLAADIERHLNHEPVVAGPPTTAYRAVKFMRRHRVGVGVAASALLVLVVFAATMTVQAGRIARERDRANREAEAARQSSEFLQELFEISDPDKARGSTVTARELLDQSAERILGGEIDKDEVRARLLGTIGNVYRKLGLYESAQPLLAESLGLRRSLHGDEHRETLVAKDRLAILYFEQDRFGEAEALFSTVLDVRRRLLGSEHLETLYSMNNVAYVHESRGRYAEAEPLYRATLEQRKRLLGSDHPDTLISMSNMASLYEAQARYVEAERLYLETLETMKRVHGNDHPDTLACMNMLATLYRNQGRYREAESLFLESLATFRRVLGDDHPDALGSMNGLAAVYWAEGRYGEAEPLILATLETRKRVLGDDHSDTLQSMNSLANLYDDQGRDDEAERLYLMILETRKRVLGHDHPSTSTAMNNLALCYFDQGRYDDAEPHFLGNLEIQKRIRGEDHPFTLNAMYNLACLEALRGSSTRAMDWLRQAVDAGIANADMMARDSDLSSLHGDPEFDALVERARQNAASREPE